MSVGLSIYNGKVAKLCKMYILSEELRKLRSDSRELSNQAGRLYVSLGPSIQTICKCFSRRTSNLHKITTTVYFFFFVVPFPGVSLLFSLSTSRRCIESISW